MSKISEKVALVTGSSSAIGRSIIQKLLIENFTVYAVWRKKLPSLRHPQLHYVRCDLEKSSDRQLLVKKLKRNLKSVEVLVHAAGGVKQSKNFDEVSEKDWSKILGINLVVPADLTKSLLPLMQKATMASVIFIGSFSGVFPGRLNPHYVCAKSGLVSLTQYLARNFSKPNLRFFCLSPDKVASGVWLRNKSRVTLIDADEIADWVVTLTQPAANLQNGRNIILDKGRLLDV